MQCGSCGYKETVHTVTNFPFTHMGKKTIIPDLEGELCPECGEIFYDAYTFHKLSDAAHQFKHECMTNIPLHSKNVLRVYT